MLEGCANDVLHPRPCVQVFLDGHLVGAEVDVEVQSEAQPQEDVPRVGVVGDPRITQRTQKDGVAVVGEGAKLLVRDRHPVPEVALGPEVLLSKLKSEASNVSEATPIPESPRASPRCRSRLRG
jgi:hypothetical protein